MRIVVELLAMTAGFSTDIDRARKNAQRAFRDIEKTAFSLRGAFAAVGVGFAFREIIKQTVEAESAVAQLANAVKNAGTRAGLTQKQFQQFASEMQKTSIFSEGQIERTEAVLLTFDNISGKSIPRLIKAAGDLSTTMGGDLESAAFTLARAFNDPAAGLAALTKQGVQFSEKEKETIKALVDTGRAAEAQDLILQKLEKRYGGAADAATNTLGGALKQLQNNFGSLFESSESGSSSATDAIKELNKVISDPQVKQGLNDLASGFLSIAGAAAKAAAGITQYAQAYGEDLARSVERFGNAGIVGKLALLTPPGMAVNVMLSEMARRADKTTEEIAELAKQADVTIDAFKGLQISGQQDQGPQIPFDLSGSPGGGGPVFDNKQADESIKRLKMQIATYGELTEVQKISAQIESGLLGALDVAHKQELIALASKLDALGAVKTAQQEATKAALEYAQAVSDIISEIDTEAQAIAQLRSQGDINTDLRAQIALMRQGVVAEQALYLVKQKRLGIEADLLDAAGDAIKASTKRAEAEQGNLQNELKALEESSRIIQQLRADAKDFTIHIGLDFDEKQIDQLVSTFDGLDKIEDAFRGIGGAGEEAIQHIVDATKAFKAASIASSDEAFGAYLKGSAMALQGVQSFVDSGSSAFQKLGVVISALNVVSAIQAILNQGSGDPYSAFARMAAMAVAVAGLGIQVAGAFGGSGSSAAAVPTGNANEGTGTVLGDATAQSESIANALELLTDIAGQDLDYSAAQLQALRSIDASLSDVGNALAQNFAISGNATPLNLGSSFDPSAPRYSEFSGAGGLMQSGSQNIGNAIGGQIGGLIASLPNLDPASLLINAMLGNLGSFSEQVDSGLLIQAGQTLADVMTNGIIASYFATIRSGDNDIFGGDHNVEMNDQLQALDDALSTDLTNIVGSLGGAVIGAVDALGLDVSTAQALLDKLPLGFDKISLQGLTAAEVSERLSAVFSALGDTMAEELVPAITDFQQVGEGAFETLQRVSAETQAVVGAMDQIGIAFGTLTGLDLAHAAEDLIDAAGGLEGLASGIGDFYDAFFTDEEKFANSTERLNSVLADLGLGSLPDARDGFRDLVTSLDITTAEGRDAFVTLTNLAGLAGSVYDDIEEAAADALDAEQEAADALASLMAGMEDFADTAARLKLSVAGSETALFDMAQAIEALSTATTFDQRADAGKQILSLIENEYNAQVDAITKARDEQVAAIEATRDADIERLKAHAEEQSSAYEAQQRAYQSAADQAQQLAQIAIEGFTQAKEVAQDLLTFVSNLKSSELALGTPFERLAQNLASFRDLADAAKGGDIGAGQELSGVAQSLIDLARDIYGSAQPFRDIYDEVVGSTTDAATGLADSRQTPELVQLIQIAAQTAQTNSLFSIQSDRANELLDRQIAAAQAAADAQIAAIDDQSNVALAALREQTVEKLDALTSAVLTGNATQEILVALLAAGDLAQESLLLEQINALRGIQSAIAGLDLSGDLPQFAAGGITSGPSIAGEAGPEAVIPLPSGYVPVRFEGGDFTSTKELIAEMRAVRAALESQRDITVNNEVNVDGAPLFAKATTHTLKRLSDGTLRGDKMIHADGIYGRGSKALRG